MSAKLSLPGRILLLIGCGIGLLLAAVLLWADIEALLYGFGQYGKQSTRTMQCPHFLTADETGRIRVRLKNTASQTIRPTVKLQASARELFRTHTVSLTLAPGESQVVEWEVDRRDVVWRHLIFVKMYTFASYPMPDVEQTCGILVIDFPWLRGQHIYWLALALFVGLTASGAWMLLAQRSLPAPLTNHRRSLLFLAASVAAAVVAATLGWWLPGIFLIAAAMLTIGVLSGQALQK